MKNVVHIKKARKARPEYGIRVGDECWVWSYKSGGSFRKRYFKTAPRRSQVTSSEFLSAAYAIEEELSDLVAGINKGLYTNADDLESNVHDVASTVESLGQAQSEKYDNQPVGLQDSENAQRLQTRAESCETFAQELESAMAEVAALEQDADWADNASAILEALSWGLE